MVKYIPPLGKSKFVELEDVPNSYSGQKRKILQTKDTEDGLEFIHPWNSYKIYTWGNTTPCSVNTACYLYSAGNVGFARANLIDNTKNFIGFTKEAKNQGEPVLVQTSGVVADFTGLTFGNYYYLTNTPGVISTTPGDRIYRVGIAVSDTELLILKDPNFWRTGVTTYDISVAGTQTITLGINRIPKKVNIIALLNTGSGLVRSDGCYDGLHQNCVYFYGSFPNPALNTSGTIDSYIIYFYFNNGSTFVWARATIAVSNNVITLTWSHSDTAPTGTAQILWEAE